MTRVLIPRERSHGETRVAATPETVKKMVARGLEPRLEAGAGEASHFPDGDYEAAGARVGDDPARLWREADVVLTVSPPDVHEDRFAETLGRLRPGSLAIGFMAPYRNFDTIRELTERRVGALAMELIPRITRAQPMDALSSQASVAGYKAAVLAASRLGRYFPLLMTAAGTIPAARVVIMGAGVAGLQALATAKRLGAVVEVSDIRPAVKEQVASLGGRYIDLPTPENVEGAGGYAREMDREFLARQRALLKQHIAAADVVITTAQIPGKPAPLLVTRDMVAAMRPGSVIVDLAAERGGNCELCKPDVEVVHRGVLILGPVNLPATVPRDASTLYARNVLALLFHVLDGAEVRLDREDEIVAETLLTCDGEITHRPTAERLREVHA